MTISFLIIFFYGFIYVIQSFIKGENAHWFLKKSWNNNNCIYHTLTVLLNFMLYLNFYWSILVLAPLYRWENEGIQKVSNFLELSLLLSVHPGVWAHLVWIQHLVFCIHNVLLTITIILSEFNNCIYQEIIPEWTVTFIGKF